MIIQYIHLIYSYFQLFTINYKLTLSLKYCLSCFLKSLMQPTNVPKTK